jgi:predicted ATPase/transcriptional regulator with XRE-family HTH domain
MLMTTPPLQAEFAALLRSLRRERGLTQEELAERAGLSLSAVSYLERGLTQSPHTDTVQLLCSALELGEPQADRLRQAARAARGFFAPSATASRAETAGAIGGSMPLAGRLPEPLTRLIGREWEVNAITKLLGRESVRLLTLSGPAGVGKTRLAIQAAMAVRAERTYEVALVDLIPIQEPDRVLPSIAQALGVRSDGATPLRDALVTALAERNILLVLDNFEQVLPAARVVVDLLGSCPRVKALVTSRAALNVRGEHEFTVPPLELPDAGQAASLEGIEQCAAVELFVERAQAAQSTFALITMEQGRMVATICARLDGLPLAIELAAARIRHFSLRELNERLIGQAPLNALAGGAQDLADHQRTMRSAIAWSYGLLSPDDQFVFRMLSVFEGGASVEGISAVTEWDSSTVIEHLSSLVDQNLVQVSCRDANTRYLHLVTLRAYGLEQLREAGELSAAKRRHAEYCAVLAERARPSLIRCDQETLLLLSEEHDNLRAALRWAGNSPNPEIVIWGLRIAGAVWMLWEIRGFLLEGVVWLETLLARGVPSESEKARTALANAWVGTMVLSYRLSRYQRAYEAGEYALALRRALGDQKEVAIALNNLGNVAIVLRQYDAAEAYYRESIAICDEIGHPLGKVKPLLNLGTLKRKLRQYAEALAFYQESLALGEQTGEDDEGRAILWNNIGDIQIFLGDPAQALPALQQGLALFKDLKSSWGIAMSVYDLGRAACCQYDWEEAARQLALSVEMRDDLGDSAGAAQSRVALARVQLAQENPSGAADLLKAARQSYLALQETDALWSVIEEGAALACARQQLENGLWLYAIATAQRDAVWDIIDPIENERRVRDLAHIRQALGEEVCEVIVTASKAYSLEEALVFLRKELD